jgi:KDO2-lipid IV(A) lauroyltransferase
LALAASDDNGHSARDAASAQRKHLPTEGRMAEKRRSAVVDYLVYFAVRLLVCVLQALSFSAARAAARFLAWAVFRIDKRHRLVAQENLAKAYPGKYSDAEIDHIVRAVYRHFCTVLIEIVQGPRRLHVHNWKQYVRLHDAERFIDAMLSGRPLLMITGHLGNWEMGGYVIGLAGFRAHAIARPLDNPFLDDYLRSFRERTGQRLLAKHGDFEKMQQILDDGGVIGTLVDQDAGKRGLFVDFFGRPASTHKAVALLAMEHRVPMLVMAALKNGDKYGVVTAEVIAPENYERSPDAIRAMTQRFTADFEQLVRLAPEQYFWVHRRWKHQPLARGKKRAA